MRSNIDPIPHHHQNVNPMIQCITMLLMIFAIVCTGCGSSTIHATPDAPEELALTLFTRTTKQQLTYFEITSDSHLRYAGGLAALQREGVHVTKLTPQQKQDIWTILIDGKLHEAGAGPLFPDPKEVSYDLAFNTGGFDHIIRRVDGDEPALKALHDYLFKLQAQIRYNHPIVAP